MITRLSCTYMCTKTYNWKLHLLHTYCCALVHVSLIISVTIQKCESNEVHEAYVFSWIPMHYILLRAQCLYLHILVCADTCNTYVPPSTRWFPRLLFSTLFNAKCMNTARTPPVSIGTFLHVYIRIVRTVRIIHVTYWCEMIRTCSRCTVNILRANMPNQMFT